MKVRVLERTQIVPRPLGETFRFFSDPRNLQWLTPAFLNFKFLSPPPEAVHPGTGYRLPDSAVWRAGALADAD